MNYEQYEKLYSASRSIDMKALKSILASEYNLVRNLIEITESSISSSLNSPTDSSIAPLQNIISNILSMSKACETMDSCVDTISHENNTLYDEIFRLGASIDNSIIHVSTETYANAGDLFLVKSLRQLLESKYGRLNWIRLDVEREVTENIIGSINRSKVLVIGGGGLFLKDTNRNEISGWQWPISKEMILKIQVPIYVLGVGYNRFRNQEDFEPVFYENITALVEKSAFFGLRNLGSVNTVKSILPNHLKDKVQYFPCATNVASKLFEIKNEKAHKPTVAINCAFDREYLRFGTKKDTILKSIAKTAKALSANYDILCYLHCAQDIEMCEYFNDYGVPYGIVNLFESKDEKDMIEAYSTPWLILGMRGHSQMVAFGCGTPAISIISHDKIKWFLDDINHPEWGLDVNDDSFEEKLLEKSKYMLDHSTEICEDICKAQDILWNKLQSEVSKLTALGN